MNPPEGYRLMEPHERPDCKRGDMLCVRGGVPNLTGQTGSCTVELLLGTMKSAWYFRKLEPHVAMKPLADVLDGRVVGEYGIKKWTDENGEETYLAILDTETGDEISFMPERLVEFCTEVLKIAKENT